MRLQFKLEGEVLTPTGNTALSAVLSKEGINIYIGHQLWFTTPLNRVMKNEEYLTVDISVNTVFGEENKSEEK